MVIEFTPKPQPTPTVDKAGAPNKSVEADHLGTARAPKPARPKTGVLNKAAAEKNGELF